MTRKARSGGPSPFSGASTQPARLELALRSWRRRALRTADVELAGYTMEIEISRPSATGGYIIRDRNGNPMPFNAKDEVLDLISAAIDRHDAEVFGP